MRFDILVYADVLNPSTIEFALSALKVIGGNK